MEETKIAEMQEYLNRHCSEQVDLKDLAREFGFSYHYLSAYFHQYAREGFSEYLNRIRVEKACELLESGDTAISDISRQVGYTDHSYFCRVFKKLTGDTPGGYRRKKHRK